jgi:hypothetical protein
MKTFAAACLISLSYAFSMSAIGSLQGVSTTSGPNPFLKGMSQVKAAPAVDKVEGF